MSSDHFDAEREIRLLRAAIRAIISFNDTPEGATADVESILGDEAADAVRRALEEQ